MHWRFIRSIGLVLTVALAGCVNTQIDSGVSKSSTETKGVGTLPGPAVVSAPPPNDKARGTGAPTGAAPGAGLGGGSYQDRQEAELQAQLEGAGVRVQRAGDNLKLILPSNIAFAVNSEQIQPSFTAVLDRVVATIRKFDKTMVDIRGYTDSTGSFEHNQALSERRAQSVTGFLLSRQIAASRVRSAGYGPRNPIASNTTEIGRSQNRRIEINILLNKS